MKAGFTSIDITPPVGASLNGFLARLSPSQGVDVPLSARLLLLETKRARCLIVGFDLLGLSPEFADQLIADLSSHTGVRADGIILSCSHTHSGPMTARLRGLGPTNEDYLRRLRCQMDTAAREVCRSLQEVSVAWGTAPVGVGVNRRVLGPDGYAMLGVNPSGRCDRLVRVLQLRSAERSILLFNHACHPYCLGAEHPLISSDFWGYAAEALEQGGHECIYLNGCAGNIAPRLAYRGPEGARQTGRVLSEAVLQACQAADPQTEPALSVDSAEIWLEHDKLLSRPELEAAIHRPNRTVRNEENAEPAVQQRLQSSWEEWLNDLDQATLENGRLLPIRARVSVIRIGNGAIVALPGEVFFEIGDRIADRLAAHPVCVASYCHGYIGYIPDASAFARGGYEVDEAHRYVGLWRVSPNSEAVLTSAVDRLWKHTGE